jgi:hypothetical protein
MSFLQMMPMPERWAWACSFLCQVLTLILVMRKGKFRKLPLLATFALLNIFQAGFLVWLYSIRDIATQTRAALAWSSQGLTLFAQVLATVEVLRRTLKPYRGIWGLGWRSLIFMGSSALVFAVYVGLGNWAKAGLFLLNQSYHLVFVVPLVVCLVLIRYYSIPVPRTYRMILAGFAFYSAMELLTSSILQSFSFAHSPRYSLLWEMADLVFFLVAQLVFIAALWKPLPADEMQRSMSSSLPYDRLSPQINEQLRRLDERLMRLWKPEAHPN